jgi:hypothetical protein
MDLDEIIEIPLRNYFPREDLDFTPWLAENMNLLGEAIGLELITSETESMIGNYRLDILAVESGTNRKIAIENQFGTTDHSHLGQLITYMAGANAYVVVWIAEEFRDEHITAINQLNQISNRETNFFGIKPRLIKIGNSKPALEFVIKAEPDSWEKDVVGQSQLNERELKYQTFWKQLINIYSPDHPEFKFRKPPKNNYLKFMVKNGISYEWGFTKDKNYRLALWIDTGNQEKNHEIFDKILIHKPADNDIFEDRVIFFKNENVKLAAIYLIKEINSDIMNLDDNIREELFNWSLKWMPIFRAEFDPLIDKIVPSL